MNHRTNAQFFLYLAERGLSFAPHTPRRHSDRVGLLRAICRELQRMDWYGCRAQRYISPTNQELWICGKIGCSYAKRSHLKTHRVSPLARLRLLMYFSGIIPNSKYWTEMFL